MRPLVTKDRYAGEAAWTEWFEICSVAGCRDEHATKLRAEIESAMTSQLLRCGFSVEDAGGDDPVAFFDSYFKLKGSREKGKPLKLYFAHRIQAERLRMLDFVCGTLFGSRSGRIHDIVVDWISSLKGWKARIVRGEDGCRRCGGSQRASRSGKSRCRSTAIRRRRSTARPSAANVRRCLGVSCAKQEWKKCRLRSFCM